MKKLKRANVKSIKFKACAPSTSLTNFIALNDTSTSMERLPQLVQNLPPELQDLIYDFTFTPNPQTVSIRFDYKPPSLLTVDRASREKFAKSYYGTETIFIIETIFYGKQWLSSLPKSHLDLVREFCVRNYHPRTVTGIETQQQWIHLLKHCTANFGNLQYNFCEWGASRTIYHSIRVGIDGEEVWVSNLGDVKKLRRSLARIEDL